MTLIRVPGSSANLGPGFDVLGMAVDRYLDIRLIDEGSDPGDSNWRLHEANESHLAVETFREAGGAGRVALSSLIPPARGLGFSGAARAAGLFAAAVQQGSSIDEARDDVFARAAELEGHGDNVAASIYGGVTVAVDGVVETLPLGCEFAVVLWIPANSSGTDASRQVLPRQYGLGDVVFNIGRVGLLAAALANGTVDRLGIASEDRLHQEQRLVDLPESADALQKARDGGAYCAWLSGSGPTVAALCDPSAAGHVARQLPGYAEIAIAKIDHRGARCR